jgi:hypothetical protein
MHNCPDCGLVIGRDHLSAFMILDRGWPGTGQLNGTRR